MSNYLKWKIKFQVRHSCPYEDKLVIIKGGRDMKVTFIHDFPIHANGEAVYPEEEMVASLKERYLSHIRQLDIICRKEGADLQKNHGLKAHHEDDIIFNPIENYSSLRALKNRGSSLRKMEPVIEQSDFIILRLPSILGVDAYRYVRKFRKPYIVEVVGNGYDTLYYRGGALGKIIAPYYHRKVRNVVKNAGSVIYVTEQYLQDIYPNDNNQSSISNVTMEVDSTQVTEEKQRRVQLKDYPLIRVGFMGAMNVSYKNFYNGLKFLQTYAKKYGKQFELSIAGGGEHSRIEKLYRNNPSVKLIKEGELKSRSEVNDWFKTLDLFIHPSLTEGLPRVVLEAMNNQIPVIASNAGGTPEIIEERFIFAPVEYTSFERALTNILNENQKAIISSNSAALGKYDRLKLQQKRDDAIYNFIQNEIIGTGKN